MPVTAAQLTAKVSVEGDEAAKQKLNSVHDSVEKTSGGFKSMLGNALSFAGGMGVFNLASDAFGFLKDQLKGAFDESMNAAAGMAQTEQVLKSTHDASGMTASSIADLAGNMSHLTEFSDDTTQAAENMLLTFTNIGKNVFPDATKTVLDMSQALGQDTKSSAIQLGKALNDPIQGITALSRVGVTFTDGQKSAIKQMMDTNNVAGAQKIILKELAREFGGSAEAAGKTFPGQLKILGQYFDDFKQQIGDAIVPVLKDFVGLLSTQMVPKLEQLGAVFGSKVGPALQSFARIAGTDLSNAFKALTTNSNLFIPVLAGLGAILVAIIVPAMAALATEVVIATWPFLAIGAAVGGLVAIFMHFYQTSAPFKTFIDGLVKGLQQAWSAIQTGFAPALTQVGNLIRSNLMPILQQIGSFLAANFMPVWQQLVALWNGQLLPLFKQIGSAVQPMLPLLGLLAAVIGGVLVGAIAGVIKGIAGFLSGLMIVVGGIVQVLTGVMQVVGGIIGFITDLVTGHFDKLGADLGMIWQGILNIFQGAWQAIAGVFQTAWYTVAGIVGGFVQGIIGFFQALANTLVHHSIVPDMVNAIISWIAQLPGRAMAFISGLVGSAISRFMALSSAVIAAASVLVNGFLNWIGQLPGRAMGFVSNLIGQFQMRMGALGAMAMVWGADLINGFVSSIAAGIGQVANVAAQVAGAISSHLHFSKPDVGPLADVDTWMPDFTSLLADGITAGIPKLRTAMQGLTQPIALSVNPRASSFAGGAGGHSFASMNTPAVNPQIVVQSPPVYLDGRRLTRGVLPHFVDQVRAGTGGYGF